MPTVRDPQRAKLMEQWLREAQGFAIYFRLGIISRDEWRDYLREAYGLPLVELPEDFEPPVFESPGTSSWTEEELAFMAEHLAARSAGNGEPEQVPAALPDLDEEDDGSPFPPPEED
jgi:hypothetical protein